MQAQAHPFRLMSTGEFSEGEEVYEIQDNDAENTVAEECFQAEELEYEKRKREENISIFVSILSNSITPDAVNALSTLLSVYPQPTCICESSSHDQENSEDDIPPLVCVDACDGTCSVPTQCSKVTEKMEEETKRFIRKSSKNGQNNFSQ